VYINLEEFPSAVNKPFHFEMAYLCELIIDLLTTGFTIAITSAITIIASTAYAITSIAGCLREYNYTCIF
jgi:hypothetical protein